MEIRYDKVKIKFGKVMSQIMKNSIFLMFRFSETFHLS